MIEFVMSRVWMVIAGLALTGVVLAVFIGLDDDTRDRAAIEGADALADLMEELRTSGQIGEVRIEGREVIFDDDHNLRVCSGSIWVRCGPNEHAIDVPFGILLADGNRSVDILTIHRSDHLVLRSFMSGEGEMTVQLEKVEATSLTASTNLLHSSSVL